MAEAVDKGGGRTWAAMVGDSLSPSLNKNVLEIVLEKETRGGFSVSELDCARVIRKLKLDGRPGDVESIQICPNGRGVILITLRGGVDIEPLCGFDQFVVTESGIRAVMIKPSGKREVMVTMKGIHPNTSDSVVMDYLNKFGKISSNRVSYGAFGEGPLKGIRNGDRGYKVETRAGINIPTYHVIDGNRVTVRYAGQQPTCARCHQVPGQCKGKGVAKKCDAEGGKKVDFLDYIYDLWARIGHNPSEPVLEEGLTEGHEEDTQLQSQGTAGNSGQDPSQFTGVSIRSLNREQDQGEIVEFLVSSGLKEVYKDNIKLNSRGEVTISDVENIHCQELITALHMAKVPGEDKKTLKCNGIIPYSPTKPAKPTVPASHSGTPAVPASALDLSHKTHEKVPDLDNSSEEDSSNDSDKVEDNEGYTNVKGKGHKRGIKEVISPSKDEASKKTDIKPTPDKK